MKVGITKYPLFFTYRDLISGTGFLVQVTITGRVLLDTTADEYWMYGVQPGGIAGGGPNRDRAFLEFRSSYQSVLYDLILEAKTFEQFKSLVEVFFSEINQPNSKDWDTALSDVRRSKVSLDGMCKVSADSQKCAIQIIPVDLAKAKPQDNQLARLHEAA